MKLVILMFIAGVIICAACNNNQTNTQQELAGHTDDNDSADQNSSQENTGSISLGEKMFILCGACHSLKEGEAHKTGPNLHKIFGSEAASREGFVYSEALKNSNIVWDQETLRDWIANPMEFLPGTNMAFVGIKKKEQQDALLDYITKETQ